MFPTLKELTKSKFFMYFRVDISKECPFWKQSDICTKKTQCELTCKCEPPMSWVQEDMRKIESKQFSKLNDPNFKIDYIKPQENFVEDKWSFDHPN